MMWQRWGASAMASICPRVFNTRVHSEMPLNRSARMMWQRWGAARIPLICLVQCPLCALWPDGTATCSVNCSGSSTPGLVGSISSLEGLYLLTEGVHQSPQLVELRQCAGHVEETAVRQERAEAQRPRCFEVLVLPQEHAPCEAQAVSLVAIAHPFDAIDRHRHAVREVQELGVEMVGETCGDPLLTLEAWRGAQCCESPHPRQVAGGVLTGGEPLVVGEAALVEYLEEQPKL